MADPLYSEPPLHELDGESWLDAITGLYARNGRADAICPGHHALYLDRGPCLIVSFETAQSARDDGPDAEPAGLAFARESGWSALTILAEDRSWFRDPALHDHFDGLVDDGFFDEFDRVLFYGAGPWCGYAACAYSVAAPGADVLALRPMASGDPLVAGWDKRFPEARRLSFRGRYGFAPEMVEAAGQVWIAYDSEAREDAMHAALLARPNVTPLRMRHFGPCLEEALHRMGVWDEVLRQAAEGTLSTARFAAMMRARREDFQYLRALILALKARGARRREALVLRNALPRVRHRYFRRRARALAEEMQANGETPLPEAVQEAG